MQRLLNICTPYASRNGKPRLIKFIKNPETTKWLRLEILERLAGTGRTCLKTSRKSLRPLLKLDEDGRHVVAANTLGGIGGEALVEEFTKDGGELGLGVHSVLHELADLVVAEDFPDTVATHENEAIILVVDDLNVGHGRDKLLLGLELGVLLVLEITDGTGEVQVTVDSAVNDKAASVGDTLLLNLVVGLVVLRQTGDLTALVKQRAGITGVGDVDLLVLDQDDVGSASCVALVAVLVSELLKLLLAFGADQDLVHDEESSLQGLLVLAILVLLGLLELSDKVLGAELCDLGTTVAIEDGEEGGIRIDVAVRNVSVLHVHAPALHAVGSKAAEGVLVVNRGLLGVRRAEVNAHLVLNYVLMEHSCL